VPLYLVNPRRLIEIDKGYFQALEKAINAHKLCGTLDSASMGDGSVV